jgi:carboxyl-terminal processing protease
MRISRILPRQIMMIAVGSIIFLAGFTLGNLSSLRAAQLGFDLPPDVVREFDAFWQSVRYIRDDFIDEVPTRVLVDGAIAGMVEALEDEYSGYMDAETYPLMNSDMQGEIEGIGVIIRTNEAEQIEIVGLLDDAPAQSAGILPGDIFAAINGEDALTMTQLELSVRVRGPAGTPINIEVLRGDERLSFTMNRERIVVPNTESEIVGEDYAYVRLNQFTGSARADLEAAFESIDATRRSGLIFDLRSNPGGYLHTAVDVASMFMPSGTVVIEDFGAGDETVFGAHGNPLDLPMPIVVLVDEGSASASELLAGALQDTGRATIMGETTVGKGTVQVWHDLLNGGGLRVTIARWLTPDRRWIDGEGITPDVIIPWTPTRYDDPNDVQLQAAIQYLDVLTAARAPAGG